MEKRLILFFVLTFFIFAMHSKFFGPKPGQITRPSKIENKEEIPKHSIEKETLIMDSSNRVELRKEAKVIYLENPFMKLGISTLGGGIQSCVLRGSDIIRGDDYSMFNFKNEKYHPGGITRLGEFGDLSTQIFDVVEKSSNKIVLRATINDVIEVTKKYFFSEYDYILNLDLELKNIQDSSLDMFKGYDLTVAGYQSMGKADVKNLVQINYIIGEGKGEFQDKKIGKIKERKVQLGPVHWAGLRTKYFSSILDVKKPTDGLILDKNVNESGIMYFSALRMQDFSLGANEKWVNRSNFYLGPNDWDHLEAKGRGYEIILGFDGFLGPVTKILLRVMRFFNGWVNNYGLAIILLTVLIKIIFFPLTHMSFKSMKKMKVIQPLMAELKVQYKDNPKKMQTETMSLYKKHGVNPLGGCLPMVVQIPIFIAFYQLLMGSIELRGASFLWISNLSEPDTLFSLGPVPINILPLIMGVSMVWQQKMTPMADPNQAKMMMFMPILFTFLFYGMGSGLVLYWLTNNVLSIAQQYWINKSTDDAVVIAKGSA